MNNKYKIMQDVMTNKALLEPLYVSPIHDIVSMIELFTIERNSNDSDLIRIITCNPLNKIKDVWVYLEIEEELNIVRKDEYNRILLESDTATCAFQGVIDLSYMKTDDLCNRDIERCYNGTSGIIFITFKFYQEGRNIDVTVCSIQNNNFTSLMFMPSEILYRLCYIFGEGNLEYVGTCGLED